MSELAKGKGEEADGHPSSNNVEVVCERVNTLHMSIKSVVRDAISSLVASRGRAALGAACLSLLLSWSSGTRLYPLLWGQAEQTIN